MLISNILQRLHNPSQEARSGWMFKPLLCCHMEPTAPRRLIKLGSAKPVPLTARLQVSGKGVADATPQTPP